MNEFEFIKNIKKKFSLQHIGDDCAVLPKDADSDLLVTADLLIEDIDFRLDWTTPEALGHKCLAVSLSDIAAMGGSPDWSLVSVGVPEALWSSKFLDRFYDGWHELAGRSGVKLVGGDISRTPAKLVIDSTVGGSVATGKSLLRSGAQPGDTIYVTGPLGAAAGGLRLLNEGVRLGKADEGRSRLITRQLMPEPRLDIASRLIESGAVTAMIDLSDGLSSDLAHICRAGNIGALINSDDLPFEPELMEVAGSVDAMLDLVLNGGEDFELLFTAAADALQGFDDVFPIGKVTSESLVIELNQGGKTNILPPGGYRHF